MKIKIRANTKKPSGTLIEAKFHPKKIPMLANLLEELTGGSLDMGAVINQLIQLFDKHGSDNESRAELNQFANMLADDFDLDQRQIDTLDRYISAGKKIGCSDIPQDQIGHGALIKFATRVGLLWEYDDAGTLHILSDMQDIEDVQYQFDNFLEAARNLEGFTYEITGTMEGFMYEIAVDVPSNVIASEYEQLSLFDEPEDGSSEEYIGIEYIKQVERNLRLGSIEKYIPENMRFKEWDSNYGGSGKTQYLTVKWVTQDSFSYEELRHQFLPMLGSEIVTTMEDEDIVGEMLVYVDVRVRDDRSARTDSEFRHEHHQGWWVADSDHISFEELSSPIQASSRLKQLEDTYAKRLKDRLFENYDASDIYIDRSNGYFWEVGIEDKTYDIDGYSRHANTPEELAEKIIKNHSRKNVTANKVRHDRDLDYRGALEYLRNELHVDIDHMGTRGLVDMVIDHADSDPIQPYILDRFVRRNEDKLRFHSSRNVTAADSIEDGDYLDQLANTVGNFLGQMGHNGGAHMLDDSLFEVYFDDYEMYTYIIPVEEIDVNWDDLNNDAHTLAEFAVEGLEDWLEGEDE